MTECFRIVVRGLVQGVGFRPFVYRLARSMNVTGYVRNISGSSVEIHLEKADVEEFVRRLMQERPSASRVESIDVSRIECVGYSDFVIEESMTSYGGPSMIPPDVAICEDCIREIENQLDRRYGYAFNSCVNCGPRYSMMYSPLYDRANTSMGRFPLCEDCTKEYKDPGNLRRFHAQGISCPRCGPRLWLADRDGTPLEFQDPVEMAARLVSEGHIVAVKGIGGFHIAANPFDDGVVARLRARKRRPTKPFAVMVFNMGWAEKLAYVGEEEKALLASPQRPIVLVPKKYGAVSELVAPGLRHIGLFLPYSGIHYLLLKRLGASIMTSGNPHGEPMVTSNEEAIVKLKEIVDYFLLHNREIVNRVDDSVVRRTLDTFTFLRRGRGYSPAWLELKFKLPVRVLSMGADLQSAGGLAFDDKVILTQFIGDIDEPGSYMELLRYLSFLASNYSIRLNEAVIAVDRHPRYLSRRAGERLAKENGSLLVEIQHHHAHLASVLAESGGKDDIGVGIAIDGIGYGDNGEIWGGEVMEFGLTFYRRLGGLRPVLLTGGDRDVLYPARTAFSMLLECEGEDAVNLAERLGLLERLPGGRKEAEMVIKLKRAKKGVLSSSMGRALDAASALLGFSFTRTYEGEPAILLEENSKETDLRLEAEIKGNYVDVPALLCKLGELLRRGYDRGELAYAYQYALGEALAELADSYDAREVYLSGGAAVNTIIVKAIRERLRGSKTMLPRYSPPGDGGIAVGQAVIGALVAGS